MQLKYTGEIIMFSGGINDWVGELDPGPHKNGQLYKIYQKQINLVASDLIVTPDSAEVRLQ